MDDTNDDNNSTQKEQEPAGKTVSMTTIAEKNGNFQRPKQSANSGGKQKSCCAAALSDQE